MPTSRPFAVLAGILACALLAACAAPRVETGDTMAGARLPPPDKLIVSAFTTHTADIRPNQAARLAQTTLQRALVARLREKGLPADAGRAESAPTNALLVQGQIVGVDDANRTRRASVSANVQLLYVLGVAAPRFLESLEGIAASIGPRAPSEGRRSDANPEATDLADAIAARIVTFAESQHWLPPQR